MDAQRRVELYGVVDRWSRLPMLLLALAMLPLLLAPVLLTLPPDVEHGLLVADVVIWAMFAADLTLKTTWLPPDSVISEPTGWMC